MKTNREEELEKEIARLKTGLKIAKARGVAMIRVGLELRTRLTSALGYTKLLIRRRENIDPLLLTDALDTLHAQLKDSVKQICDLGTFNHPAAGTQ